jgi:serine/threonine protein phosphatase PrpC
VLDCDARRRLVYCGNVGDIQALLLKPQAQQKTQKANSSFTFEWITELHTVGNRAEEERLKREAKIGLSERATHFEYADFSKSDEIGRYSRAMGHQAALRKQGMLAEPTVSQISLEQEQWIVVATSGFWHALSSSSLPSLSFDRDAAAASVVQCLTEYGRNIDPNRVADRLLELAVTSKDGNDDESMIAKKNKTVVVICQMT